MYKQQHTPKLPISLVRSRRKALLQAGINRSELTMLEEIALQMRDKRMRTLKGSYLAACLGVSRQWANTILRRLDRLGLILRFKTGLIRLNLEKLNKIRPTVVKTVRRKVSKWLKERRKSASGNNVVPNKGNTYLDPKELPLRLPKPDVYGSVVAGYVPPHLRKGKIHV